jgi:Flp pilus assembly protein TadD
LAFGSGKVAVKPLDLSEDAGPIYARWFGVGLARFTPMSGAVFLSYASQDAEVAKRICEALRAAGIEVWFDQTGLRGGDAWDAKIRRQIKECALFVPVISDNTNIRVEGYFRLEWKLAVDRSHLVADDVTFILPVVLGEISAPAARVPDKFREVQWTRMSLTVTPTELAERIARLLAGEPAAAGAPPPHRSADQGSPGPSPRRAFPASVLIVLAAASLAVSAYFFRPLGRSVTPAATPSAATPASEAQKLADKARAIYYALTFTRSDLAVAEELARKATESDPDSAYAWGVRAGVQAAYIQRYWAFDDKVSQDTDAFAKRALALNPDESQALLAVGYLLVSRNAFAEAEVYLRHAYRTAPADNRIARALGRMLAASGRIDEGTAILEAALRRDPRDAMAHFDLAQMYYQRLEFFAGPSKPANLAAALAQYNASLAILPTDTALTAKARMIGTEAGDVAGMRFLLDQVTPEGRGEDRTAYTSMACGLMERRPDRVLAAAAPIVHDYLEDAVIAQPTAWSTALAYRIAGKENLARAEWQAAESTLRKRVQDHPNDLNYQVQLATTLAWLDRLDEAAQKFAPVESTWREQPTPNHAFGLARYYAALGDSTRAVPLLRSSLEVVPSGSKWMLKLYPWWDKLRGQPEFDALLAQAFAADAKK